MEVLSEILLHIDSEDVKCFKSTTYEMQYFIEEVEKNQEYWRRKLSRHLGFEVSQRVGESWRKMYENLADDEKELYNSAVYGYEEIVAGLTKEGFDFSGLDNYAIQIASNVGHTNVVKLLLQDKRVDPSANKDYSIRKASKNGHADVVRLLLKDGRVDPSAREDYSIGKASENGHADVVKLLLEDGRVDPSRTANYAILVASENGHVEVVKLLLKDPNVNPSAQVNYAIRAAAKNGHLEVVELLLKDPRVNPIKIIL